MIRLCFDAYDIYRRIIISWELIRAVTIHSILVDCDNDIEIHPDPPTLHQFI